MSCEEDGGAKRGVGRDSWCDHGEDHTATAPSPANFLLWPSPVLLIISCSDLYKREPRSLARMASSGPQEGPGHDCPSRGDYLGQEREGPSPGRLVRQVLAHEDIPGRGRGIQKGRARL